MNGKILSIIDLKDAAANNAERIVNANPFD